MAEITIGNPAVTGPGTSTAAGYTIIDRNSPATGSGTLVQAKLFAKADMLGVKVGTFYLVGAGRLRCRGAAVIPETVQAGAERSYLVALPVMEGDLFGCYAETGGMAYSSVGPTGMYYMQGDLCTEDAEGVVNTSANYKYSMGGVGETAAVITCRTLPATDLTSDGATLHGSATGLSESEYATHRGFEWGTTPGGPYSGNWSETDDYSALASMSWDMVLTELEPGIPVYYRAYIKTNVIAE